VVGTPVIVPKQQLLTRFLQEGVRVLNRLIWAVKGTLFHFATKRMSQRKLLLLELASKQQTTTLYCRIDWKMNFPACAWQLYLFSLLFVGVGIFCHFPAACDIVFGAHDCSKTSVVVLNKLAAVYSLWAGVLFGCLTYSNEGETAKLKRLAMFATNAIVAWLVMVMMFGSTHNGGYETTWMHVLDMVGSFILLAILATITLDESDVVGANNPFRGLGTNAKSFVWLLTLSVLAEMICYTDIAGVGFFIEDAENLSELSRLISMMAATCEFVLLLAYVYSLLFGDSKDHVVTLVVTLVMMIVTALSFIGHYPLFTSVVWLWMVIGYIVIFVLGVLAWIGQRREGYERIET